MPFNPSSPPRLSLGAAAGAMLAIATSACLAYTNGTRPPPSYLEYLTVPTRACAMHSADHPAYVVSDGDNNYTNQDQQDEMEPSNHQDQDEEDRPMMWTFLQLGTILLLGAYSYYTKKDDETIKEMEIQSKTKSSSPVTPPSSSSSAATTLANNTCPIRENARKQGLVLYAGNWYSVSEFVPHHPGGAAILHQYLGADITFVFRVMHRNPESIIQRRKPSRAATKEEIHALAIRREEVCQDMMEDYRKANDGTSEASSSSTVGSSKKPTFNLEAFEKDAHELYQSFVTKGYFKPTLFWLIHKTVLVLFMLSFSILGMRLLPTSQSTNSDDSATTTATTPPISYILPGIFLGLFWHQSGFLMHDAEHHNLIGNERINDILGWMYGTVFLGVNGAWWREEHREHHALLNTFDEEGVKDPQMREDVWIQHKSLIPFYGEELIHFLTNFQHIFFIPIIFFAGRIGIVIDSTLTERKFRPWTIFGNILHILLHYAILSQTSYPLKVYIVASFQQAILSLQLLGNHYTTPWNPVHVATEANYCVWQMLSTQDFVCPTWAQWYYGGLNFHYTHHLFPTLPRERFHVTTPCIKKLCEKHGVPFVEVGFKDCVVGMVTNFNEVRKELAKSGSGSIALMYT